MARIAVLLLLALCPPVLAAGEAVDWNEVTFGPLEGTAASLAFEMAIDGLATPGSEYMAARAEGELWRCCVLLLHFLAEVERGMTSEGLLGDPAGFGHGPVRMHAGRTWEFWDGLARLCDAAAAIGHPELLAGEALRLRIEMERAITPLLAYEPSPPAGARRR